MQPRSTRFSFESVEQLDEMVHKLGWDTEYRQLDAGGFSSTIDVLEGDGWFLLKEQSSRTVDVQSPPPEGMYVLALVEGNPGVVNGQAITHDHIFLQRPGSGIRATLPAGTSAIQVGIAAKQFEDMLQSVAPWITSFSGESGTIGTSPGALDSLHQTMQALLLTPARHKFSRNEAVSNLLATFIEIVADHDKTPVSSRLHRPAAQRALNRAKELIDANLENEIRVQSLCTYAGANLRTLQRIFAREFGYSPQQYIKIRRLNAAHRHLFASTPEEGTTVTDVATGLGFSHLGRFSGDYRHHFGEYPQDTLRVTHIN